MPLIRLLIVRITPQYLIENEQDARLSKAFGDDLARIRNLVPDAWYLATVDQVDYDSNVPGLDEVENVFANPVDRDRHHAKADDATPIA